MDSACAMERSWIGVACASRCGSAVKYPGTSLISSHLSARTAAASSTAVKSEPPRRRRDWHPSTELGGRPSTELGAGDETGLVHVERRCGDAGRLKLQGEEGDRAKLAGGPEQVQCRLIHRAACDRLGFGEQRVSRAVLRGDDHDEPLVRRTGEP